MRESAEDRAGAEPAESAERRASTASTVSISDSSSSSSHTTEERTSSSKRHSRRTDRSSGDSSSGASGRGNGSSREEHAQRAEENREDHSIRQRGESSRSRRLNREDRAFLWKGDWSCSSNIRSPSSACGNSQSSSEIGSRNCSSSECRRRHSSSSARSGSSTETERSSSSSALMVSRAEIPSDTQKNAVGSRSSRGHARSKSRRTSARNSSAEQDAEFEVAAAAESAGEEEEEAGARRGTHHASPETKKRRTARRVLPLSVQEEKEEEKEEQEVRCSEKAPIRPGAVASPAAAALAAEDVSSTSRSIKGTAAGFRTRRAARATKTAAAAADDRGIATEAFLTPTAAAASLNSARLFEDEEKKEADSSSDVEVVAVAVPVSRWTAYLRQQREAKEKSRLDRLTGKPDAGSLEEPEKVRTAATADVVAPAGEVVADAVVAAREAATDVVATGEAAADVIAAGETAADVVAAAGDTEEVTVLATAAAEREIDRETKCGVACTSSEAGEATIAQRAERAAAGRAAAKVKEAKLLFPEAIHPLTKRVCKGMSIAGEQGPCGEGEAAASSIIEGDKELHASNSRDILREREENCSERVLQTLLLLASRYEQQGEARRAHGFRVAAAAVRRLCFGSSSSGSNSEKKSLSTAGSSSSSSRREAQKKFETAEAVLHAEGLTQRNYKLLRKQPGIGDKIFQTIEELILMGSSSRMHALSSSSRAHALEQLQRVWGVGFHTAERLLARAINSVATLRDTLRRLEEVKAAAD